MYLLIYDGIVVSANVLHLWYKYTKFHSIAISKIYHAFYIFNDVMKKLYFSYIDVVTWSWTMYLMMYCTIVISKSGLMFLHFWYRHTKYHSVAIQLYQNAVKNSPFPFAAHERDLSTPVILNESTYLTSFLVTCT